MEDHHFSLPSLQLQRLGDDTAHQILPSLRLELDLTLEGQRTLLSGYRNNALDCEEPLFHEELEAIHLGSDLKLGEKKWETDQHPIEDQVMHGLGSKADEREESVDSLTKRAKVNTSKEDSLQDTFENTLQMKVPPVSQPSSKEKSDKTVILETTNLLATKRNCYKKGSCSGCSKRKFVFTLNYKASPASDDEVIEKACAKCLFKKIPKRSLLPFIVASEKWNSTDAREPLSKELTVFGNFCRQRNNSSDLDEELAIVNSILREKIRKLLTLNGDMVSLLSQYHTRMNCKERMLAMKIVHDTSDCIVRLNTLILEPKVAAKLRNLNSVEQRFLLDEVKLYLNKLVSFDRAREPSAVFPPLDAIAGQTNGKAVVKPPDTTDQMGEIFMGKRAPLDHARLGSGPIGYLFPNMFEHDYEEVASVKSQFSDHRENFRINGHIKH